MGRFFLTDDPLPFRLLQRCAIDDDFPPFNKDANKESILRRSLGGRGSEANQFENVSTFDIDGRAQETESTGAEEMDKLVYNLAKHLSCKGTTGAGPSIGCAQEYPADLQFRALEQVNLSPPISNYGPIPSPRQSPKIRLSPTPRAPFQQLPKA
ncbi:IQ domain-containing protein IQM4-like [Olea europaea var. sylvestris]|uniref:IQ domain-containing protein IQM4-like n=1 Tax=Olea europaea var. sylvestris TaxID=158386 RepID=UPI000C1D1D37|nr:IQ domain-containing protein IQM4-like [Olea europaea var. sylvestris]